MDKNGVKKIISGCEGNALCMQVKDKKKYIRNIRVINLLRMLTQISCLTIFCTKKFYWQFFIGKKVKIESTRKT
jgi:hypothetical protein